MNYNKQILQTNKKARYYENKADEWDIRHDDLLKEQTPNQTTAALVPQETRFKELNKADVYKHYYRELASFVRLSRSDASSQTKSALKKIITSRLGYNALYERVAKKEYPLVPWSFNWRG